VNLHLAQGNAEHICQVVTGATIEDLPVTNDTHKNKKTKISQIWAVYFIAGVWEICICLENKIYKIFTEVLFLKTCFIQSSPFKCTGTPLTLRARDYPTRFPRMIV
jgi:hypothetical protein